MLTNYNLNDIIKSEKKKRKGVKNMKYTVIATKGTYTKKEINRYETNDIVDAKKTKITYQAMYNCTVKIYDNETNEEVVTKNYYRRNRVYHRTIVMY